jgi:DNA-binding response OmpR family regulator
VEEILVVEDSRAMQKALRRLFESDSLQVHVASDGIEALTLFREHTPTAVILDLKLPGRSGKELCREFKTLAPQVPIVVVSANSEVEDKVLLLELGADDYVTKPFSPKELLARVRRAIRRGLQGEAQAQLQKMGDVAIAAPSQEVFRFDDVVVNFTTMEAQKAGKTLAMTAQEFKVLHFFAKSPARVISREELLNEVWGYQNYPSTRTVDNHILRLRQKLENDPSNPTHFVTVHGAGYKFLPVDRNIAAHS